MTAPGSFAHAFVPGTQARRDAIGRTLRLCAICGRPGRGSGHRLGSLTPTPKRQAPLVALERPQPVVPPAPAPAPHPWQLYALEAALAAVVGRDDIGATTDHQVRQALRAVRSELHPSTVSHRPVVVPDAPTLDRGSVVTSGAWHDRTPQPTGAMGELRRRMAAGFRSDKMRQLFIRAIEQGWTPSMTGDGHAKLVTPSGGVMTLSMTSDGGARAFLNNRAKAKRLGLDVSGL